jgi:alanine racemase
VNEVHIRDLRPAWVEVDLDAFEHNLRAIQSVVGPGTGVMAIVKADGYGHGAVECSRVAQDAGCKMLGVAILGEALELRRAGLTLPILVLGYTPGEHAEILVRNDIDATVYGIDTAKALSTAATRLGRQVRIHIKIETGMGRLGLVPGEQLKAFLREAAALPNVVIAGVFTHFAASDADKAYTESQFSSFQRAVKQMSECCAGPLMRHTANSAAIMEFPETRLDMVRPGIVIYGYYPSETVMKLAPVKQPLSLKARIAHVRWARPGETIGYGRTYTTTKPTRVAILPLGYADGYNRALSNRGRALVRGHEARVIGRVCMDQMMIDVTTVPRVAVDDEAVLIGQQGSHVITADDLARAVGTISHEILTRLGQRLPRVYKRKGRLYTIDPRTGAEEELQTTR